MFKIGWDYLFPAPFRSRSIKLATEIKNKKHSFSSPQLHVNGRSLIGTIMSVFHFAYHYDPVHHWPFKLFSWNLLSISILNHNIAYRNLDRFWVCIHLWYYILRTRTILLMLDRCALVDEIIYLLISDHLLFTNAI